jgi:hypothetical protein
MVGPSEQTSNVWSPRDFQRRIAFVRASLRRSSGGGARMPVRTSHVRSSPEAGHEACGNVLRIFPVAREFRREQTIL